VLRDLDIDERRFTPREMSRFIEQQKQKLIRPSEVAVRDAPSEIGARVYSLYEERMQQSGAVDFNDLLMRMVLALRDSTPLRYVLQNQWEHVLVDEFQDTNLAQLELVRVLCEKHRNLCVVGDDDQSIYKWRGAERRNILDFRSSFAEAKIVKLEQNYRSSGHILAAAMAIITRNAEREPKQLWTQNAPGEKARVIKCGDERDEARAISETLRQLKDHGLRWSQMAVFYRTHAQSRVLEEEMRARNIAYRVIGGQRFYERSEVKDVLAYLRVIENPQDDVSLLRIINTPARGIGKTTLDRLLDLAAQAGRSVWTTLHSDKLEELPKPASQKLRAFVTLMEGFSAEAKTMGPFTLAQHVLDSIGYLSTLRDEDSVEADGRIENVKELLDSLEEFEREAETPTLSQYLELITLQTNADELDATDKLTLMTVHAAKGLEFPVVWVAGLEERLFPLSRGPNGLSFEDLEEERRLAYVAFTRAEQRLFLSYAVRRRLHGEPLLGIPSPFLDELPEAHIARVSRIGDSGYPARSTLGSLLNNPYDRPDDEPVTMVNRAGPSPGARTWSTGERVPPRNVPPRNVPAARPGAQRGFMGASAARPNRPAAPARASGESYVDRSEGDMAGEIAPGMRVRHAKYGEGDVLSVERGTPIRVTVRFQGWGVKQIVASYLEASF
jgi:DNA helicase-2/ATP-dependent DNA helicase PcrA